MTSTLLDRLEKARKTLAVVKPTLNNLKISVDSQDAFRKVVDSDVGHWTTLLETKNTAWKVLDDLETNIDKNGKVQFSNKRIGFVDTRFLGVQSYLATSWALADCITGMVGRVLLSESKGHNGSGKLVMDFIKKDRKKSVARILYNTIRSSFGWPVGISYAIRNHFIHDGAPGFFEGPAFGVSEWGWKHVVEEKTEQEYGVDPSLLRNGQLWPQTPRDDLRKVLEFCEREMDDALGILLGTACHTLQGHVGFMLGQD